MTAASERVVQVDVPSPGGRSYPIFIGNGNLSALGVRLREYVRSPRVAVVTDSNVGPLYADAALTVLGSAGFEPSLVTVPAGEQSKSLDCVSLLYDELARARIDRESPLVALGGGVVGDLTGFVAASWLRGVPFVQCPTTLEADVDSSVGGKTGVNHASGKNMIGAFYQPLFVLIDTATLATLSDRDFRAGLAESIKHAVIRDRAFFDWQDANADAILGRDGGVLSRLIEHNVRIKAAVVAEDERETRGVRAILNFGHTVGHAVETLMARAPMAKAAAGRRPAGTQDAGSEETAGSGQPARAPGDDLSPSPPLPLSPSSPPAPWRHGECVAVGMVAACEISVAAGRLARESAERIIGLIGRVGLPLSAPLVEARHQLWVLMQADKKTAAGQIRFVLADAIGQAALYDQIEESWVAAGLDRVLGTPGEKQDPSRK